jgi:hypothetical protein
MPDITVLKKKALSGFEWLHRAKARWDFLRKSWANESAKVIEKVARDGALPPRRRR